MNNVFIYVKGGKWQCPIKPSQMPSENIRDVKSNLTPGEFFKRGAMQVGGVIFETPSPINSIAVYFIIYVVCESSTFTFL